MIFRNKKILIGITGGIAAYKTCYLIRSIKKQGGSVRIILTGSGSQFVGSTTLEAISGEKVATDLFEPAQSDTILHIDLARWPDLFVIAPATANTIAKTVHGIADDILSTVILACSQKIIFAPAMNEDMWNNKVTQENLKKLNKLGHKIIPPGTGELACETEGIGRMAEPAEIEKFIIKELGLKLDLTGKKILVTAGGTEEPIDPVRVIGNRSSGKMGIALAEAAASRGAEVTLIAGTHSVHLPKFVTVINVRTAAEMQKAVEKEFPDCDVLIMAAAVADFKPAKMSKTKIKKGSLDKMSIDLEPTQDILKEVTKNKQGRIVVGFSLETDNEIGNARKKLKDKNLDLIVLNNPLKKGSEFGSDSNRITILQPRKKPGEYPLLSKADAADNILDAVSRLF
ncbi:bifunctional phosphopantothenoylcysteine decarboxylase/phosphopantothenate--cysteine ligase CoaBC [candidate division KSB1 bacterium]